MPTSRTLIRSSLLALSFALPFGFASVAQAAACGDGPACPKNYECRTQEVSCDAAPCAGDDCEPVDCGPSTYSYCAPLPCTADTQCDEGMVCYTETRQRCDAQDCGAKPDSDGGDDAGDDAAADCEAAAQCEDVTESGCVPKYALPCTAAEDCGIGFTCEAEEECECTGSSGSADAGSDAADPAPPAEDGGAAPDADAGAPDCTCQPSERKSCSLKIVACSVDEGCPIGWTCGDNPNGVCWGSSDGSSGCSADPEKICLPPYSGVFGRGAGTAEDGGDTTGTGGGVKGDGDPLPGDDDAQAPHADDSSANGAADSSDSGGCAIGHAPSRVPATLGFAALALVGLLGARRRNR